MAVVAHSEGVWLFQRPDGVSRGRKKGVGAITHEGCVFEGVLTISNPELAKRALIDGLGTAKAYGFGLLSLAPLETESLP